MNEEKAQLLLSPFNSSRFTDKEIRLTDLPFVSQNVVKQVFKRNEKELAIIRQDFWKANWHHMVLFCLSALISSWMVFLSITTSKEKFFYLIYLNRLYLRGFFHGN